MTTYTIDKSRLDNFLIGRTVPQWAVVLVSGAMFVRSNLNYDWSGRTTANIIWYCVLTVFIYCGLIGILLLLKRFKNVMKIFLAWDETTTVTVDNEKIEINRRNERFVFTLSELTIENHQFYGGRVNPLNGLGYTVITTPSAQTITLSSILFDFGNGVDKAETLFANSVKMYSKKTIGWFKPLPR